MHSTLPIQAPCSLWPVGWLATWWHLTTDTHHPHLMNAWQHLLQSTGSKRNGMRFWRNGKAAGCCATSHLGTNIWTYLAARKFITTWWHISKVSRSENCACWHIPTLCPIAIPTVFLSISSWSCPLAAVMEKVSLDVSDHLTSTTAPQPSVVVLVSVQVHVCVQGPKPSLQRVEPDYLWLYTTHGDGSLDPSLALQSSAVMIHTSACLPLELCCSLFS